MVFVFSVVGRGEIQQLVLNLFLTVFVYGLIAVLLRNIFVRLVVRLELECGGFLFNDKLF